MDTRAILLNARLKILLEMNTRPTRRFADAESHTDIPARQWASWWNERAKPSPEMLSAVCIAWPQFVLWLMTGATDEVAGQISPDTHPAKIKEVTTSYLQYVCKKQSLKDGSIHEGGGGDWADWECDEANARYTVRIKELARELKRRMSEDEFDLEQASQASKHHFEMARKLEQNDPLKGPIHRGKKVDES
jgi:hypothetical protein